MKNLFLFLLVSSAGVVLAQGFDQQRMDSLFTLIESNEKGMGSLSIFENGKETYQNAFGFADFDENIKAANKTIYRIGSISKTFTAAIIMGLVEDGKLSLATKLSEFYPEIQNAEKITIEQLLRHRTGIFNFTSAEDYTSWMEQPISKENLVKKIIANGKSFEPDEKFGYSNSNYVLLSLILETIENKEFGQLVQEEICTPCALVNTYYGSSISVKNNEAKSYTKLKEWIPATETNMSVPIGAGALVSTPTDLNKFLYCLFRNEIVTEQSLKTMTTIQDGYGMGLLQVPFYDKKGFGHTGGIDGFQSNAFYFPNENVSIAYLSNGVVMSVNDVLIGALSIYFGKDYDLPEFKPVLQLSTAELDKYLGVYSSPSFPLKVTITKNENNLIGQATGQPSFPLEAYEKDKFRFDQAGLTLEFLPSETKMILRQGGGEFELKR